MIRAFIDLADNVAICITKERYVAFYEDLDYSSNILDVLYSKLVDIEIEEAVIVMHGNVSLSSEKRDLQIENLQVSESNSDYAAMRHLFGSLGVGKLFFYDFAGYWASQVLGRTLIVDQEASQIQLIVYADGYKTVQVSLKDNLEQNVQTLCNRYDLDRVMDAKSTTVSQLLTYFENADSISSELAPRFSLFAFTMTKAAAKYSLKLSACSNRHTAQTAAQPLAQSPVQSSAQLPEQALAQSLTDDLTEKPKKNKKVKEKKKRKFGIPFLLAVPLSIVLLGATGASMVGTTVMSKRLHNDIENVRLMNDKVTTESIELVAYQRVDSQSTDNSSENMKTPISCLASLDFANGKDYKISSDTTKLTVTGTFKTKQQANSFIKKAKRQFELNKSSVKDSKNGVNMTITVEIA